MQGINIYLSLKLLHELAAFWFVAGILGRQLTRTRMERSQNIHHFASLSALSGNFESWMVIPGNLLVIVFGLILAWSGGWPVLGFLQGASKNWLLVTNLILLSGFFVVPLVYLPRGKVFDQELQTALERDEVTPKLVSILRDPVIRWAHRGEYIGLLIILALMVLKPF